MELKSYIMQQLMALDGVKTKSVEFEVNLDGRGLVREHPTGNVVRFTVDVSGSRETKPPVVVKGRIDKYKKAMELTLEEKEMIKGSIFDPNA